LGCATRKVDVTASARYGWPIKGKGRLRPTCA
jgi:hypothetical protein